MKEYNPNAAVDFAAGLQNAVNSDINAIRTYNSRANQVDSDAAAIADQPIDALVGVLQFSKTLKDQFKAREDKKLKQLVEGASRNNIPYKELIPLMKQQNKAAAERSIDFNKMLDSGKFTEDGVAVLRTFSASNQLLQRKALNTLAADGLTSFISNNLNKAYNVNGVDISFNGAKTGVQRESIANQLRNEYIESTGLNPSDEVYSEIWHPVHETYFNQLNQTAQYNTITASNENYNKTNTSQILSAVKNPIANIGSTQFEGIVQNHAAQFGGDVAAAFDDLYNNTLVKQIEDGQISRDEYYNFISGVIDHKGAGLVSIERGFGKKLRTTYLNEQFRKQELEKQKEVEEFRKAQVQQAEQAAVEQFKVQINKGTFNPKSVLAAKATLWKIDSTYVPTKLDKVLETYKSSPLEISIKDNDFAQAYEQGTLTVFQVEQEGSYLQSQWLEKAKKSEAARKGDQYKLQKKAVNNILKKAWFAETTDYELSTEGTAIQGELNNYYEKKVNKYLLRANTQEEIDTAINQAAIDTKAYFYENSNDINNLSVNSGQRYFYDEQEGFTGVGQFPNMKNELKKQFNIDQQPDYAEKVLREKVNQTKKKVFDKYVSLDVANAYLTEADVKEAIDQMEKGSYSNFLKLLSSTYNLKPQDILTRQAIALGYKQEDIPKEPTALKEVYEKANEEMICLINKVGIENFSPATAKRLCFSLSEEGINDEALRQELDVY
jgi:hypothetical protein